MYTNYIHKFKCVYIGKVAAIFVVINFSTPAFAKLNFPNAFELAANYEGIDPLLLYAVALQESKNGKNGYISPSLFAIRDATGSRYFDSQANAEKYLRNLINEGVTNIDVGAMQINYGQHRDIVKYPELLLDPYLNFRISAKILKYALQSAPNDIELGVGRYHNWRDSSRSRSYGEAVLKLYRELIRYEKVSQ